MAGWITLLLKSLGGSAQTATFDGIACLTPITLAQPTMTATALSSPTMTATSLSTPAMTPTELEAC